MATSRELVAQIKRALKAADMTYADLARALGLAESSVKRMLARGDMPLSRVDAICRALQIDFADLAQRMVEAQPLLQALSLEQERAVVADEYLLLVAICVLSEWSFEQMLETYALTEPQLIGCLLRLDRLGVIELRPFNRYRLKLARTFRWRPDGPVMRYFRERVVQDYFGGGFEREDEVLMLVHGSIGIALAPAFRERLQALGRDFSRQHQIDQRLDPAAREGYTLVLAMRRWEFSAFERLLRSAADRR